MAQLELFQDQRTMAGPDTDGSVVALEIRSVNRRELPKPICSILDDHRYILRLLKILESESRKVSVSSWPGSECMLSIMHYIQNHTDRYHHPKEELIFATMKFAGMRVRDTMHELMRQHEEMEQQADEIVALIKELDRGRSSSSVAELKQKIVYFCNSLKAHMLLEEERVFPYAYSDLSKSDWRKIDRKIAPIIDPVFGPIKSSLYAEIFERYVAHTVSVSRGVVPVGLIENVAGFAEKFLSQSASTAKKLFPALNKRGGDHISQFSSSAQSVHISSDADSESYSRGDLKYDSRARISWQASLTNLLLRVAIKPYLGRARPGGMQRVGSSGNSAFQPPGDIITTEVDSDQFEARWILPEPAYASVKRTLLYLPGGGFIFPASAFHCRLVKQLAEKLEVRGMLVHYRLAPEYPFPAGLEDAVAAYRYLLEEQGVAPEDIILAGDSAGGGLTLSLLLSIREQGLPMPSCATVFSPFTDLSFSSPSMRYNKFRDPLLPSGSEISSFDVYARDVPSTHPLVSPLFGSFEDFPPILAQVSSTETLLDDTLRLARKARSQDVKFEVEVWQGLPHVFQLLSFLPESAHAIENAVDFIKKQMDFRTAGVLVI